MSSSSTPPVPPLAETLARKLVEHAGDYAIVCADPRGVIVSWNAAAEALLGWRAADAIGQCIGICCTTADPAGQLHAEMREARETGVARGARWYGTQDGGRVWADGQLTALRENDSVIGYAKILRDRTPEGPRGERHDGFDARAPCDPPRFVAAASDVTTDTATDAATDVNSRHPAGRALPERTVREHATAARFQALTELNSAIFWHATADGTLTYLSPQWHALTGQSPDHALPDGWVDALHPDDRSSLVDAWEHARRHGTVYETEKRFRSSAGLDYWYLIRALPQKDAHGEVTEWLGCSVDISERKTTETVLQQSEARWRELFEQMQEAFFTGELIRDEHGRACDFRLLEVNPAFEATVGIAAAQATGAPARLALPGLPADLLKRYERIVVSGKPEQYDIRVAALDNRWFEARARRIAQDRFAVVFSDITARKHDEIARFERERRQGFVLALADQLRGITAPGDALDTTSRMLGQYLGASLVAYPVVDVAARVALFEHCWAPPGHATCTGPLTLASLGVAPDVELRRGHTLHFASDQHPLHEGARACSTVMVPLYRSENTKTVLYVTCYGNRQWSPGEVRLIEAVAERTWTAVARIRSEIELEKRVASAIAERDQIWLTSPDMIAVIRADHTVASINPAVQDVLGWSPERLMDAPAQDYIHPDDLALTREHIARLAAGTAPMLRFENRYLDRAGNYRWLSWTAAGAKELVYAFGRDITERKVQAEALRVAEDALRQSQKMEAVGQLTGGVAHDFNNLLQGILSPLELVQRSVQLGRFQDLDRFVSMASASAKRAAALTHRLLAFSRRQPIDPKPTDVNQLVASMADLVHRTLGESVTVEMVFAPEPWQTRCDPNQLENALLNLAINARDAMPAGGRLTVETVNVHLDHAYVARHPDVTPGEYVAVCVSDTGTGMSADIIARAFEPFYTTKPIGKGTGLGLSMVYGFAKQSGGTTSISSEVGSGTTLRIYLPRFHGTAVARPAPAPAPSTGGERPGKRTVALVEDDPIVRALVRDALAELGFDVLEAVDGHGGAELVTRPGSIDLLVTDVGLPGLNGRQVAEIARQSRPALKVLFMTGYAENAVRGDGFLDPGMAMITKPFSMAAFAMRIAEMTSGNPV